MSDRINGVFYKEMYGFYTVVINIYVSKQQIMCPGPVKLNSSKESDQTTKKWLNFCRTLQCVCLRQATWYRDTGKSRVTIFMITDESMGHSVTGK